MEHNNFLLSTAPAIHDSGFQPQVAQDPNVQPSGSELERHRASYDLDEDNVPSSNQKRKPRRARKQRRKRARISGPSLRMTESRYTCVCKQLFQMLRHELEIAETVPDHPLHQYDALQAKTELTQQLAQYHLGHPPFRQFLPGSEGTLQYWQSHCASRLTFVLAYLAKKVFSVLPNSMCDERTGSRLTCLYSKLRTRMGVQSMTEQIQFSQFSAMIDGTDKLTRRKKSRPILRFQDIPEHQITHYTAPDQTEEEDDSWLNGNSVSMDCSITPDTNSIPSLNYPISSSHGVDITSQLLVGALSAAHIGTFSALLKPESSDSDGIAHSTETGAYIRAAEVCWDD